MSTVVVVLQVILLSFLLLIVQGNQENCGGRQNNNKNRKEDKKQIQLLKGSGNLVARYLVCDELVDEQSCRENGNDDVDVSCFWNYEQQQCQINQDSFQQLVLDCEDAEDYLSSYNRQNVSQIDAKTQNYQLTCSTLKSVSNCMIDKSQQSPQLSKLAECETGFQSEMDFCAQANAVEIGLLMVNNVTDDLYPYHLKHEILAQFLFPNSTQFQNEFLQYDGYDVNVKESTSYTVDPSPTPQSGGAHSQAQLGVLNFFLYCGLMLLLLGTAIGIFQACQMLTRSSHENACKLIVI
eukprot:TRINITY_DN4435_c1_g2_i1.p1 TRINITY_DN4435_c1_g2~~TRINITY_DN4435_c1_g2_i1.p1  ORF type:complete len:302 (+),score=27.62 TRINITY_DN4435_c1_g2_i1:25-906(+)